MFRKYNKDDSCRNNSFKLLLVYFYTNLLIDTLLFEHFLTSLMSTNYLFYSQAHQSPIIPSAEPDKFDARINFNIHE